MYISFTNPFNLIFLFVIPLIMFLHFFGLRNLKGKALKFANFNAMARIRGIDIYSKNISLLVFDILFVMILVFSISGLTLHAQVKASSFSFVIAIDSSESMSATDMLPNRLEVAKETAKEFVSSSPYDSPMGVISFAGNSYIEQELSNNNQEIKSAIDSIEINPVSGTDIYEAIVISTGLLKNENSKAIILLSDGQINVGSLNEAIQYAKYNNVLVHTIAIGTVEGGEVSYGISKLDEDSLKSVAHNTGGEYFNVRNEQEMKDSFNKIMQETTKLGSINLYYILIVVAIILFIFRQFLISMNKILW